MKVDAEALKAANRSIYTELVGASDGGTFVVPAFTPQLLERAITAYLASLPGAGAGEPVGWKLVPVEPTPEMLQAVVHANRSEDGLVIQVGYECRAAMVVYAAMIATSPVSPAPASLPSESTDGDNADTVGGPETSAG